MAAAAVPLCPWLVKPLAAECVIRWADLHMAHERVPAFAELARRYCFWAEQGSTQKPADEAATILGLLVELYGAALLLPQGEGSDNEVESNTHEEWQRVYQRFASLPVDVYYEVFDPLESPADEPVAATLGDDLADIHRDLQRGLVLYNQGDIAGASWEWAFQFRAHWGRHVIGALTALHSWWVDNYFEHVGNEPDGHASRKRRPNSA
jgi:hypothetical protein